MSFDLEKLQAVAELGEVIRLQNEALERLQAFRKARPYMMMPNLAKMVEENIKENVTVLYKELNNLHKPAEQQTRYVCRECKMAFISALPGGLCDECRARLAGGGPREYVPYAGNDDDEAAAVDRAEESETPVEADTAGSDGASQPAETTVPNADEDSTDNAAEESVAAREEEEKAQPVRADEPETEVIADGTAEPGKADAIEDLYAAAISGQKQPEEPDAEPAESGQEPGDDNYDNPGDKIELAAPAPEVAKPEDVEGVDISGEELDDRKS